MCIFKFIFTVFLFCSLSAHAEKDFSNWKKYSQADLIQESSAIAPGSVFSVGLRIRMQPGWHTYWVNPGDSGAALRLSFNLGPGLRVRRVMMPMPHRFETGPLISFGYDKEVIFPIELEADSSLSLSRLAQVKLEAEWLVCEDVCLPANQPLSLEIPVRSIEQVKPSAEFSLLQMARARVPQMVSNPPPYVDRDAAAVLTIADWRDEFDFSDFFPFKGSGVTNEAPHVKVEPGRLELMLSKSNVARVDEKRIGVLVGRRKSDGVLSAWQLGDSGWKFDEKAAGTGGLQFWWMLLSAFIGGLILNLMPCVFPVLSIKLLSVLKAAAHHPKEVRRQNFAYVLGVLLSFVFTAIVLSVFRSAGHLVGWGFQLQSPLFLSLLIWLFFALALNLLGFYELSFFDAGLGHKLTRLGGTWGSFFTGVLAVVVASPCTAPFMGVALGFGLSQTTPVLIAVFLCLGLGLAFPYLVFAIRPGWISFLPRPGAWMNTIKKVMALPLLATIVWLAWVLVGVRGFAALGAVLASGTLIGVALWIGVRRPSFGWLLAAVALAGGLSIVGQLERAQIKTYSETDFWRPYSPQAFEALQGKNIFVNMTADWCLTCKVNERLVFNDLEVQELLKAKGVYALKGDWTEQDAEITRFLNQFGRVGVPFYVLYSPRHPEGLVLPEVLTKSIFMDYVSTEFP